LKWVGLRACWLGLAIGASAYPLAGAAGAPGQYNVLVGFGPVPENQDYDYLMLNVGVSAGSEPRP
jgi:hypothetical protein